MIKGYIFDYGGTLDTGGQHWGKVIWHAYERQHVPVSEEQFREAYVHAERTLGKNPIIKPDFTFRRTLEEKIRIELEFLGLPEYQQAVVDDLYAITCEETARSREVLLQLKQHFPIIIESAVVGVRKPDPRIFTLGVEALGLNPDEVIVVGDSMDKDIIPAGKAGCHTIWFKGEGWTNDPVDESAADKVITELNQILDLKF